MTGHVFQGLQSDFQAILKRRLSSAHVLDQGLDLFHVLFRVARHLREDLGPLVFGLDHAELGDGIQVEKLFNEPGQQLDGAAKTSRLQVLTEKKEIPKFPIRCFTPLFQGYSSSYLEIHTFRHVKHDVEVPHHAKLDFSPRLVQHTLPARSLDQILNGHVQEAIVVLSDGLPRL